VRRDAPLSVQEALYWWNVELFRVWLQPMPVAAPKPSAWGPNRLGRSPSLAGADLRTDERDRSVLESV